MCQLYLAPGRAAASGAEIGPHDLCFFSLSLVRHGGAQAIPGEPEVQ